jgi:tetratricopeptide (TPR) repeat protein
MRLGGVVLLLAIGCTTEEVVERSQAEPEEPAPPDALLPSDGGIFAPSHVRVSGEIDVALLSDVDKCAECHSDLVAQWRMSAHGRSSFDNPWYRSGVDRFREEVGHEGSRFCAGCHDPLLLLGGKMDGEIEPNDPMAHAGITCAVCHGITETRSDGRASYTIDMSPIPLPVRGDIESLEAHRTRVATNTLRTPGLCATCHRAFLADDTGNIHFLPGMDDAGPWKVSAYAGNRALLIDPGVEEQTCQSCHMELEETTRDGPFARTGSTRSHRWPGAQTALAEQIDARQVEFVREMLRRAATIDVAAARIDGESHLPADAAPVRGGAELELDVVIRNQGAGHVFPGGARDTHDTWVEVTLRDANGRMIAEAGTRHAREEDPTAHRLLVGMVDEHGVPELQHLVHRFAAKAFDHGIPARDAAAVRYAVTLPDEIALPLRVDAKLMHRRHVRPTHDLACEGTRSDRGRDFNAESRRLGRPVVGGCSPQPITEIASAVVWLGEGASGHPNEGGADRETWLRLYEHALALSHDVQERCEDAKPSLERALELLGEAAPAERRAMVMNLRATVEGRQGRVEDAIAWADRAQALIGEHPAIYRARGRAYAQVWRWEEAARELAEVARLAAGDSNAWRDLARARGSAGDALGALEAARSGLRLLPRDEQMLRSQALAVAALEAPNEAEARDAFLRFREPDNTSDLRLLCGQTIENCDRDQRPVPTIELRR